MKKSKKFFVALAIVVAIAVIAAIPALADDGPIYIESPVMNFSGTGWGGWSCPEGTHILAGGYYPAEHTVLISEAAKPGSESGLYPVYPHYTFSEGEEGWVVQNGGEAASLQIWIMCGDLPVDQPTQLATGPNVVFNAWLGIGEDGSWCALASPVPYVGVEVQKAKCFPQTNPDWVATNAICWGPVFADNTWVCDKYIGGSENRLDVFAWRNRFANMP